MSRKGVRGASSVFTHGRPMWGLGPRHQPQISKLDRILKRAGRCTKKKITLGDLRKPV